MDSGPKAKFSSYSATELRNLYENNPVLFAELADDAIKEACAGKTTEQTLRLRQQQWAIDGQLRKAKTPLGKMQIMERIFYGQVYGSNGQLASLLSACTTFTRAISWTEAESSEPDSKDNRKSAHFTPHP